MPLSQVDDFAENILSQQISRIDGVGQVNVAGQQKDSEDQNLRPKIGSRCAGSLPGGKRIV